MVQAEAGLAFGRKGLPVASHRLQQAEGARHVAFDEGAGPINRAVHVAFGGQVQHQIWIGGLHRLGGGGAIGQIHP